MKWLGDSREQIRDFPDGPRREAGYQLERVQAGKEPKNRKPMPSIGIGVNEIRVRNDRGAFQKKTRKTEKAGIELARRRFKALIEERKRR